MLRRLPLLALLACVAVAQKPDVNSRIARVEHGLLSAIQVAGEPALHYDLAERMKFYRIPGVSIAVINNGAIEWARGYGYRDREKKLPVDANTLFEAGSISKPVAAAGALSLVEHHKLTLDDDVNAKLKSWKVPDNEFTAREKVTLRRLLTHSAGLTVHGFPGYEPGKPVPTVPQVLDGATPANTPAVRVDTVPGKEWRYSGGGYTVMQLLVSDVSGKSFPDFMRDAILRKAGMTRSTYQQPLAASLATNAATAYRGDTPVEGKYHTYPEMAAAGLWTTASDLARFGIEIFKTAQGRGSGMLSQSTVKEMLTRQIGEYGLGFAVDGTRFSHNGVDEGFEAMFVCFSDSGKGAVVLTNGQGGSALAAEIVYGIAAEYGWSGYAPRTRKAIALTADELRRFTGAYTSPAGDVEVKMTARGLTISLFDRTAPFVPESETRFFSLTGGLPDVRFTVSPAGEVTGLTAGRLQAQRK